MSSPRLSEVGRRHALLVARARRLARPRTIAEPVPSTPCLVCDAGGELYALPLLQMARVVPFVRVAPVPTTNAALMGVFGRAGIFYHVYDLARLVGAGDKGARGHLVMMRGAPPIALCVDEAIRVADLVTLSPAETSQMRANHPAVTGFARPLQSGLFSERTISLIDPDKLAPGHAPVRVGGD
ncbi:MAG TPA: chemotaxis protein CheW [Hyphomonadaceae bacterium]|nr:chemotaxis protein CheW [Hyphomonadaceae bacterium]HPI48060.1 chemotaxis protein CheW [Hyphomonadaceae bacterium]